MYSHYEALNPQLYADDKIRWKNEPPFTSYATWKGVIDYIFQWPISSKNTLIASKIREIPPDEYIREHYGLPNDLYGSDHFYIQCEFVLK